MVFFNTDIPINDLFHEKVNSQCYVFFISAKIRAAGFHEEHNILATTLCVLPAQQNKTQQKKQKYRNNKNLELNMKHGMKITA